MSWFISSSTKKVREVFIRLDNEYIFMKGDQLMFYRKHRFNNDNVLAYFQVKDGAIIDRTHKNKNFVTNVTKFSKGGGFEYCTFDFRSYIKGTNQFKLSNNFFIEFMTIFFFEYFNYSR